MGSTSPLSSARLLVLAFSLLTGGCGAQHKKQPQAERPQGDTSPGVAVSVPQSADDRPASSVVAAAADDKPAQPIVAAVATKPADVSRPQPVDLGRASIAQAEEPAIRTPDLHGHDPLAADCAWFREFKRDVSADRVDPHSADMLGRLVKGNGHIDAQWSGSWTPANYGWYTIPFQVVSGNTTPLFIPGAWSYLPTTNGPYLLPQEPVVLENSKNTTYASAKWSDNNDHHLLVYVRDEATGGLKELWEYYQPYVTRNDKREIFAVAGASWRKFDLRQGEDPAPGVLATDAAGLPFLPLVVRYDEVARGSINHALRFCVNNADIAPTFKWPARTAAAGWNRETGMPYGTRLRIKSSWWQANADAVLGSGTQARIIGEALRRYGCILADGSGGTTIQLCGVADKRWEQKLHDRLNAIPASAFEVIATPPTLEIKGPTTLDVGHAGSWTMTLLPNDSPVGAGSNINLFDDKGKQLKYQFAVIDAAHRTTTAQYSFSQPGVYMIKPYHDWNTGFGPFRITVGKIQP